MVRLQGDLTRVESALAEGEEERERLRRVGGGLERKVGMVEEKEREAQKMAEINREASNQKAVQVGGGGGWGRVFILSTSHCFGCCG